MKNFIQYLRDSESDSGHRGATFNDQGPVTDLSETGGYRSAQKLAAQGPSFERNMTEARRLIDKVLAGDKWAALKFREAMTTSDFSVYFGTILDRSVLANYAETPYTWDMYCKRATIRDFRQALIYRFDRGAAVLDGPILPNTYGATGAGPTGLSEVTEYPMRRRVTSDYTDQLYKFGALMDFSWETMINDDLDALKDTPALFGRAARRTEESRATKLYVSAGGPNSTFFSTGNANLVTNSASQFPFVTTNNPVLSTTSLSWALIIMQMQRDLDGEPISIEGATLVVPPALKYTAMNIVRTSTIAMNDMGGVNNTGATGTSLQRLYAPNPFQGVVNVAVNYYLPIVNTSSSAQTAWYLFSAPSNGRPALQQSFLLGHEMPELFMKAPNQVVIGEGRMGPGQGGMIAGGGQSNPMDGDFDTDSIIYKVRQVLGGTLLDPKMAVASSGLAA